MENKNQVAQATPNQLAKPSEKIADLVIQRVEALTAEKRLDIPANYSVANAVQSAQLILQTVVTREKQPVLTACSRTSIANALFDMVVQGLNPQKKQCYFIAYGDELQISRSYFGEQAVAKRVVPGITDIFANVVYEDDVVEIEQDVKTGRFIITKHETTFENADKSINGAYAVIIKDGQSYFERMTWAEIQKSWSKSKNFGGVHKEFPQEMAKRTVIRRAVKNFINASDDSNLEIADSYNRTTAEEYDNTADVVESVKKEAVEQTGKQSIPTNPSPAPIDEPAQGQTTLFESKTEATSKSSSVPF
jgi:recombination protein RecT